MTQNPSGVLLVNKDPNINSFKLVSILRKITGVKKIGHAGTLDPFATGVMVMLIGSEYTKKSNDFMAKDKEYLATIHLGVTTDTYDLDGEVISENDKVPTLKQIEEALKNFQGEIEQIPPMYSAKKVKGQKLYSLARKGIEIERKPSIVKVEIKLLHYAYPKIEVLITCSKGTYIRSLAYDIGNFLGCGAHLSALTRTKSGTFTLEECISQSSLSDPNCNLTPYLRKL